MVGLGRRHRTLAIVVPCERVPDGVEQLRQLGLCDLAVVVRIKLQVHHTHITMFKRGSVSVCRTKDLKTRCRREVVGGGADQPFGTRRPSSPAPPLKLPFASSCLELHPPNESTSQRNDIDVVNKKNENRSRGFIKH
jgi:hypothetical protein